MLHFKGKATFKCKQCGHKFEAFDTEGGIFVGPNLPACPKCGSNETKNAALNWRLKCVHRVFICLWFVLLFLACISCSSEKKKEWIKTENGYYFWGLKASDDAVYQWTGDTIGCLAHGKGRLKVVQEEGTYTNTVKIDMVYGSIKESDWKHTANGLFLGEMEENKPQGFGVLKENGKILVGDFDEGILGDGIVTIFNHDTIEYQGGYTDGLFHGDGILYDKGKPLYIGEFKDGKFHGFGKLLSDSNLVYIGNWKNGLYHGEGVLYKDGKVIKGNWSKGLFEKPFISRSLDQIADQWNALLGKSIRENKSNEFISASVDAERFVMDSLTAYISRAVRNNIKENVEDRFGLTSMPRMLWQKLFTDNPDRMVYAQEAFIENISPEELEGMLNEKIRYYNENSDKPKLKSIKLAKLKAHEIVNEEVFKLIQARETMEYTDLLISSLLDIVVAMIIGFIVGLLFTKSVTGGWVFTVPSIIIGILFAMFTTGKAEIKLEEDISQQAIENYMNFVNNQNIINQVLY